MEKKMMMKKLNTLKGWLMLCLLLPLLAAEVSAQEDSMRVVRHPAEPLPDSPLRQSDSEIQPAGGKVSPDFQQALGRDSVPRFRMEAVPLIPYYRNPFPLFLGDYSTGGTLATFRQGAVYGSGGQYTLPGIGRFNQAALGYVQGLGDRWTLQLGVDVTKVNMSHITGQAWNTSGQLMYQATDRLAFKMFGNYAMGNTYGITTHRYGASAVWQMTPRFSLEGGVQRYYDAMRGGWQTVPIVVPTYDFGKFKLGLDVGPLLYEVLRGVIFQDKRNTGGPTIMPPR